MELQSFYPSFQLISRLLINDNLSKHDTLLLKKTPIIIENFENKLLTINVFFLLDWNDWVSENG